MHSGRKFILTIVFAMENTIVNKNIEPVSEHLGQLASLFQKKKPVVFLDFDGTLAPIVKNPDEAKIPEDILEIVKQLARKTFVGVISGRGLEDLKSRMDIPGVYFAGCHGFELSEEIPHKELVKQAQNYLPLLDKAESLLKKAFSKFPGAFVERKKFAIAAHYRNAEPAHEPEILAQVKSLMNGFDGLKVNSGKKVFDIKPDLDWHKGKALIYLYENCIPVSADFLPLFIGDDVTDEDAFRSVKEISGLGFIVDRPQRETEASYYINGTEGVREFLSFLKGFLN